MKTPLLLFAVLLTLLFSKLALAKEVGLIVWVDDMAAFNKSTYKNELRHFSEKYPELEFKTIYLKSSKTREYEELTERVAQDFAAEDKISLLVLATHGGTDKRSNETALQNLGNFGASGTSGFLSSLLHRFSPHYAENLRVVLESCSTFCGTKEAVTQRSRGLYNELSHYGVKELSIWGATQPMISSQFNRKSYFGFIKSLNYTVGKILVPAAAAYGVITQDPHVVPAVASLAVLLTAGGTAMYKLSGTNGYELKLVNDSDWIARTDYYSSSMFRGVQCRSIFSK